MEFFAIHLRKIEFSLPDPCTGNGEIDVKMKTLTSASDMTFATGNGSVTVALPSSFNGEIDASTGNGEFRSDFEIRVLGRLPIVFADWNIGNPSFGPVTTEDHGVLEFLLNLKHT